MASGSADTAGLGHLHTLYRVGVLGDRTDAQLLETYLANGDDGAEAGFAALVERHGPMVLRVCRQVLGDPHDAEDAFQATFLVLARSAGSLRRRDSLSSWLHGVARRVALHARSDSARRRRHERRCAAEKPEESPDAAPDEPADGWPELHEELARLPAVYRESVVLCYLEGLTTAAAARRLGCAQGTVLARLSRARDRLRHRLVARGLTLSAGLLAAELSRGTARAAIPADLARSVVPAATAAGVFPPRVAALAEGVLSMLFRARVRGIIAAVAALVAVAMGIGAIAHRVVAARPQAPIARGTAAAQSRDGPVAEIIVRAADLSREPGAERFMGLAAIDPETSKWRTLYKGMTLGPGRVSPDGRSFVYAALNRDVPPDEAGIWVHDLTGRTPPRRIFERRGQPFWVDEGRRVVIGAWAGANRDRFETWRVDADGSGRTKLPIPEDDLVLDASRDGTWLATRTMGGDPKQRGRLTLVHPDGTGARHLTDGSANDDRFSIFEIAPDGRSVAYAEITTVDRVRNAELFIVDIEGRRRRRIPTHFGPGTTVGVCWSPDGSRLALNVIDTETKQGSIVLVDLDGPNYRFRKLPLPPGQWNLLVCDWKKLAPDIRLEATDPPPDARTLRGRYQALIQEHEKEARIYQQALKAAKTPEDRQKADREKYPAPRSYAGRFLQLAESAPSDPAAADALLWIIQYGFAYIGPEFDRAIDLLTRDHAAERRVGRDAVVVSSTLSPTAERLLRAVVEKNPDRYTRGLACRGLGRYLRRQSDTVRSVRDDKESAARCGTLYLELGGDKEGFERFRRRDPDALMAQAEAVFERIVKEFADLGDGRGGTLGQEARDELNEMRNLVPGKPAPEVTGADVDGRPITLSDHRGRVVLLSFWGSNWGSLRGQIPYERALAARMHDRPFVILGVNDDDKEALRALIKKEGITWPSFWDHGRTAGAPGPIARQFNIHTRPTHYLVDHRGVIRGKFIGSNDPAKLDAAINELVAAAERDPGADGSP